MKAKSFFTWFPLASVSNIKLILPFAFFLVILWAVSSLWAACTWPVECYDQKITGLSWVLHNWGIFDATWNAGIVNFDSGNVVLTRDHTTGVQYLSGWLWLQTVGWSHFDPTIGASTNLEIADTGSNIRTANTLSGWLWSENAGWIEINPSYPGGWVVFDTTNGPVLNGWGYSQNLGWIQFGDWIGAKTLGEGLVWKVKVIGNLSGNDIFDVFFNASTSFASQNRSKTLNTIKKDVALATRKIDPNTLGPWTQSPKNSILYYKQSGLLSYKSINNEPNKFFEEKSRTLVIEWADLVIDEDVLLSLTSTAVKWPKAIIVLADSAGNGGNIFIKWTVKHIYSTLIAEKSIYSGVDPNIIYNGTKENVLSSLPPYQLYINGSVVSYNTIGGSSNDASFTDASAFRCPYFFTEACNGTTALRFDFNYFRNYQASSTDPAAATPAIPWYDDYSMIIEFDPKALSDPPPWLQ